MPTGKGTPLYLKYSPGNFWLQEGEEDTMKKRKEEGEGTFPL
jgi:hypothetical protein